MKLNARFWHIWIIIKCKCTKLEFWKYKNQQIFQIKKGVVLTITLMPFLVVVKDLHIVIDFGALLQVFIVLALFPLTLWMLASKNGEMGLLRQCF